MFAWLCHPAAVHSAKQYLSAFKITSVLKWALYTLLGLCFGTLCCAQSLSCVWLFATPWTVAHQASLSIGILQARTLEWAALPSAREYSQSRNQTLVSGGLTYALISFIAEGCHASTCVSQQHKRNKDSKFHIFFCGILTLSQLT